MTDEIRTIKLGELFDKKDLKQLHILLKKEDWNNIKIFLNSKSKELEKKGVLPNYLYYFLRYKIGTN